MLGGVTPSRKVVGWPFSSITVGPGRLDGFVRAITGVVDNDPADMVAGEADLFIVGERDADVNLSILKTTFLVTFRRTGTATSSGCFEKSSKTTPSGRGPVGLGWIEEPNMRRPARQTN